MKSGFDARAAKRLLSWYDRHARSLPWRVPPAEVTAGKKADPYRVWLSEIMLQQTTVKTVIPYYQKFLERWPTVKDLANAPLDDVLSAWAGLGYYARARNLKACAESVARDFNGEFPATRAQLRSLPGIGDYTSAAISAIAFNAAEVAVDGNIERVISRQHLIEDVNPRLKNRVAEFLSKVLPIDRPGDFTQAMMDLGATICTPKTPVCALCPVGEGCMAFSAGNALEYPKKKAKKAKPVRRGAIAVILCDRQVLVRQRPDTGLLGSMTEFPGTEWREGEAFPALETGIKLLGKNWQKVTEKPVAHTFTHFFLELEVWTAEMEDTPLPNKTWLSNIDALDQIALPTVMKKVAIAAGISAQ